MTVPGTSRAVVGLLVAALAAACGDDATIERTLTIATPERALCLADDESVTAPGVQTTIEVRALGFVRGDVIALDLGDGDDETHRSIVPTSTQATLLYAGVTLPEGATTLRAVAIGVTAAEGTATLEVDTSPPPLTFVAPAAAEPPTQIDASSDLRPATPGTIDYLIDVAIDLPDGSTATLVATPPLATPVNLGPATVTAGHATWEVPFAVRGVWSLAVQAQNECGNPGEEVVQVFVALPDTPTDCSITLTPAPVAVGSLPAVLNAEADPSPRDGFQATVRVDADQPGATVTLFLDDVAAATGTAGADGEATFDLDLDDSRDLELRARCDLATGIYDSLAGHYVVDTRPPTCAVVAPGDAFTLSGASDVDPADSDLDFDVAAAIVGTVDGPFSDTAGTKAVVDVDGVVTIQVVTADTLGLRTRLAAPDDDAAVRIDGVDRAGNTCTATVHGQVVAGGCPIELTTTSPLLDTDASRVGVQATLRATVGAACAGRTVTLSNCDVDGPRSADAVGTVATITATVCRETCDAPKVCTATVVDPGGVTTGDEKTFVLGAEGVLTRAKLDGRWPLRSSLIGLSTGPRAPWQRVTPGTSRSSDASRPTSPSRSAASPRPSASPSSR